MIRSKWLIPVLTTLVIEITLLGLGVWQLERRTLKHELIARVEAGLKAPPQDLPAQDQWPHLSPQSYELRKVQVAGRFLHEREAYLYMLSAAEPGRDPTPGYGVITPLLLDSGGVLLVHRGYVAMSKLDPASRIAGQSSGRVTVTGLLRSSEKRSWFSPDDQIAKKLFYTRNLPVISHALQLPFAGSGPLAPFMLEADETPNAGGWPKGKPAQIDLPDNHLSYALTWFSLALGVMILFTVWFRQNNAPAAPPSP